jgi:hypothetical protein
LRSLVSLFTATEVQNLGIQLGFNGSQRTFSSNVHRLYVDGKLLAMFTGTMKSGALDRARLGTYDPPNELFKGQVNDFRIYDRALGDAEIAALAARP